MPAVHQACPAALRWHGGALLSARRQQLHGSGAGQRLRQAHMLLGPAGMSADECKVTSPGTHAGKLPGRPPRPPLPAMPGGMPPKRPLVLSIGTLMKGPIGPAPAQCSELKVTAHATCRAQQADTTSCCRLCQSAAQCVCRAASLASKQQPVTISCSMLSCIAAHRV